MVALSPAAVGFQPEHGSLWTLSGNGELIHGYADFGVGPIGGSIKFPPEVFPQSFLANPNRASDLVVRRTDACHRFDHANVVLCGFVLFAAAGHSVSFSAAIFWIVILVVQ